MKKVNFGIVGFGNIGRLHARNIEALDNCRLYAVCDSSLSVLEQARTCLPPEVRLCDDYHKFLDDSDLGAVVISTPHFLHPSLAIAGMEHGKHIIVEKPIAVHKADAENLIKIAGKYPSLKKSIVFNQRVFPAHRKIKALIGSGELGSIQRVNWIITDWFRSQYYYDSGQWRASWRGEGGGVLLNQCPHQLDLMQWFFGMPETVSATTKFGKYHNIEVEDEVNAYLEYADGKTANFIASTGEIPGTNRLEIMAENGRVVYENNKLEFKRSEIPCSTFNQTAKTVFEMPDIWECMIPINGTKKQSHREIIANFADSIISGTELFAPLEEGIKSLELANAMLLSGLKQKTVHLPLDGAEFAARLDELVAKSNYENVS